MLFCGRYRGKAIGSTSRNENAVEGCRGASIAVLPFASLSQVSGQDYFADGLVEDVITGLSRISGLLVVARNSSFAYRGTSTDVRTISAELGVRYLLEGSVRRSGARLRINAHLIDGASASHVWAGKFDGAAQDIFDLQDRLTEQIVGIVEPSVRRAEIDRARRKRPDSLDAYDLYLRALPHVHANTAAESEKALRLLDNSLHPRSGLPSGARLRRVVPRATLFPERVRPGRSGGRAPTCGHRSWT